MSREMHLRKVANKRAAAERCDRVRKQREDEARWVFQVMKWKLDGRLPSDWLPPKGNKYFELFATTKG